MSEWQDISTAPKDGLPIMAAMSSYEWPEVIQWEEYDQDDAEEVGEPGYWRYAEDVISDVAEVDISCFTHWMPLPAAPKGGAA